jgi:hypothetical protein
MMKLWWNDICELVAAFAAIVAISAIVDVTKTHRMGHQATSLWTLHEIFRDTLPLACRYACLFWTTIPSTIPDISTSDLLIYPHSSLDEFLVGFGKKKCETNMNQNWECRDVCRSVSTSTIPSQSHQSHPPNNGKLRKEWPQVMIILPYCPSCWHLIVDHDDHWWSLMKTIIAMYFCCIDHRMKVRIHLKVRRAPRDKTGSSLIEKWEE